MKILQLIHKVQNRGAEIFACQLSNHFNEIGHDVKIVSIFNGVAAMPYRGSILSLNASPKNRFLDIKSWKYLGNIIKEFEPDIVQSNAGDTLKYAVFSKQVYGWETPIVVRNASEVGRYLRSPLQKLLNKFFYSKVAHVISVSNASQKDILLLFPFLKGKTTVIPVGLETVKKIEPMRLSPESVKHIVHVGGFTFEKNHKGLIRMFKTILENKCNSHLHLIGDGPLRQEMEVLVKSLKLQDFITFYGYRDNPLSYIKAGDILVLPSIIEGLPGVLLEAMICKTPVIAYNVGGISEIVTPSTGSLIEKGNEEEFSKQVINILETPPSSKVETAYQMVITQFMNSDIAGKFEEEYQKILRD